MPEPVAVQGTAVRVLKNSRAVAPGTAVVEPGEAGAIRGSAACAIAALPTRIETQNHRVSDRESRHRRADFGDDAGALVSEDRGHRNGDAPGRRGEVGVADSDAANAHEDFVGTKIGDADVLEL